MSGVGKLTRENYRAYNALIALCGACGSDASDGGGLNAHRTPAPAAKPPSEALLFCRSSSRKKRRAHSIAERPCVPRGTVSAVGSQNSFEYQSPGQPRPSANRRAHYARPHASNTTRHEVDGRRPAPDAPEINRPDGCEPYAQRRSSFEDEPLNAAGNSIALAVAPIKRQQQPRKAARRAKRGPAYSRTALPARAPARSFEYPPLCRKYRGPSSKRRAHRDRR